MKKLIGSLLLALFVVALISPVLAQEPPKMLTLRTATLFPFDSHKSVKGALMLDLHARPPAKTDTALEKAWDFLSRYTYLSVGVAGETPNTMFDVAKSNIFGAGITIPLVEGRLSLGAEWLREDSNWYGTLNFAL